MGCCCKWDVAVVWSGMLLYVGCCCKWDVAISGMWQSGMHVSALSLLESGE